MRADGESSLVPLDDHLLRRLVAALVEDDQTTLLGLLAPDVVLTSDGGADQRAARRPVLGRDRVARFLTTLSRRGAGSVVTEVDVNYAACLFIHGPDRSMVVTGSTRGDQIATLTVMLNQEKIAGAEERRSMR
jgi:RNA polymerase sigma-70 factor (ECF subfamily)